MSSLESLIWTVLGYSSMPVIFLTGFIGTAVIAIALLKMTGAEAKE